MCFKTLFLVVFATCAVVNADTKISSNVITVSKLQTTSSTEAIPGDLDLDGDVDVADFLIFVENFGKTGPVPTRPSNRIDTVTVRDTLYIKSDRTPQEERAEKLLGFWKLTGLSDHHYLMGYIDDEPDEKGDEFWVWGCNDFGTRVLGRYSTRLGKYSLLHASITVNYFYTFEIQGERAIGTLYFYSKGETVADASRHTLTGSGRTIGEGFTLYSSKPAIPIEPADRPRQLYSIPQDIIDEHDRLKALLDPNGSDTF